MKRHLFKSGAAYSFAEQAQGRHPNNILKLAIFKFKAGRRKEMLENILRWEDDGGNIREVNSFGLDLGWLRPPEETARDQSAIRHQQKEGEPHA